MAFAYFDRVKETTTTTGTGVIALAGAVAGFQAFSAKYANNDTMHYTIYHAATGAWEVGLGTWATGNTLTRTTVIDSSNAGAAVNFAAGTKDVFVVLPAGVPSGMSAAFFSTTNSTTRDAIPAAVLRTGAVARLNSDGTFWIWNGAAWVSFAGFAPTGSATGQTQIWNGTAWVAGALDLADADAVTGKLPFANVADLPGLSVFGRASNTLGVGAAITAGTDGDVMRRSGTAIGFGAPNFAAQNITTTGSILLGATPSTTGTVRLASASSIYARNNANTADISLLYSNASDAVFVGDTVSGASVSLQSVSGRVIIGTSIEIQNVTNGLRFAAAVVSPSIYQVDDPTASITGDTLLIQAQNATGATSTGAELQLRSGTGTSTNGALRLYNGSTVVMSMFATAAQMSVPSFVWSSTVASPQISHNTDTTAAVTGDQFQINAQDVTGTGATVGGVMFIRAGNSTNGTGGGLDIRSGTGSTSTASGIFNMRVGSSVFWTYPGTAVPASSTGVFRGYHNATLINARNNANSADINILRWGVTANDTLVVGDVNAPSELRGSSIAVGDTSTFVGLEHAFLASARDVIALGRATALTTTQMPTNSGHGVVYVADATADPTANAVGGSILYSTAGKFAVRDVGGPLINGSTFGDSGRITSVFGSSVRMGVNAPMIETTSLSGRNIVSLVLGVGITATEMPANTGDDVLFWATDTSVTPTANPVNGMVHWADTNGQWVRSPGGNVTQLAVF